MKKLIYLASSIFIVLVTLLTVKAASLYPEKFSTGDTVTIKGSGFGSLSGSYSYLCFNDDEHCYNAYNSNLTSWSDTEIKFKVPSFADNGSGGGTLYIYGRGERQNCYYSYCYPEYFSELLGTQTYKLQPKVLGIYDSDGQTIEIGFYGEIIQILGIGFGNTARRVHFPSADGEILSWTNELITVKVPTTSKDGESFDIWYGTGYDSYLTVPFSTYASPTDDVYSSLQRYLATTGIKDSWDILKQENYVTVAVIDSGIYINHPDLSNNIWINDDEWVGNGKDDDKNGYIDDIYGYDFVYNTSDMTTTGGHGTNVAGIIGAVKDNYEGIAGIADKVKLMSIIACTEDGCPTSSVTNAIYYAVNNGADIINLSLSTIATSGYTSYYDSAIKYAFDNGVIIIAASGNGDTEGGIGQNLGFIPQSPVCNESKWNMIIGVGASTMDNKYRTTWSNYGQCVDILAPGENIVSTSVPLYSEYGGFYGIMDGTSYSAPIVTGVAAIILSAYPEMSNTTLYDYIVNNSSNGLLDTEKIFNKIKSDEVKKAKEEKKQLESKEKECEDKYDDKATYNSEYDDCECITGYEFNSDYTKCLNKNDLCKEKYGDNAKYSTKALDCTCETGYKWNRLRTDCISEEETEVVSSSDENLSGLYNYYKIRKQIGCLNRGPHDARCFWEKINLVYAKEILGQTDIEDEITEDDIEWISKKIGLLETRYESFCTNASEPAKFCTALGKLIERGNYFLNK